MRPVPVDVVLPIRAALGEGAIWSAATGRLLWVDITAGRVHRSDADAGTDEAWEIGRPVGCVAERADGRIVCAATDGFALLDPETGFVAPADGPAPGTRGHRFNDGATDRAGRFVAGTMPLGGPSEDDATGHRPRLGRADGPDGPPRLPHAQRPGLLPRRPPRLRLRQLPRPAADLGA